MPSKQGWLFLSHLKGSSCRALSIHSSEYIGSPGLLLFPRSKARQGLYPKDHSPQEGPSVLSVPFYKVSGTRKLTICGECPTRAGAYCCCGVTGLPVPVFEGVLILLLTLLGTHVSNTFFLASPRTPFLIPLRNPVLMVPL